MSTKIKTQEGWKDVAGAGDTYFVRKPAWSQAVAISVAELYAGYTAPSDGIFICSGVMPSANDSDVRIITVNNIPIAKGQYFQTGEYSFGDASCPVNAGDVIKSNIDYAWGSETRYFIPFEDSTVAEPEVVTPELIRNLHDPDWSQAVVITSEQLLAGYAAPKRGIFVGNTLPTLDGGSVLLTLNNVTISFGSLGTSNGDLRAAISNVPVSQGDVIKSKAATLVDGNYNIKFVPYKAQ